MISGLNWSLTALHIDLKMLIIYGALSGLKTYKTTFADSIGYIWEVTVPSCLLLPYQSPQLRHSTAQMGFCSLFQCKVTLISLDHFFSAPKWTKTLCILLWHER